MASARERPAAGLSELPLARRMRDAVLKARAGEPLEFEQILIRQAVALAVAAYSLLAYAAGSLAPASGAALALVLAGSLLLAPASIWHLVRLPQRRIERRMTVIAMDAALLSALLGLSGKAGAIFAPLYLWAALGNGFLYSVNFMYIAMGINLACFAVMAASTPFWREAWQLSLGVALAILLVPLYVARLMGNFRELMMTAQEASRAKTEFISMISHELRTPLNAILGLAQLSRMTATSAKERFSAISTELAAGRLVRMVDTILKFQRIESGTAERIDRDFDILDDLDEVRAIIEPLARQKSLQCHIRFSSGLPARLRSDPDHIQTIILNLMANAVKYTRQGEVSLEVGMPGGESGQRLRIAVRDTGDGIAPEDQARIFDRFVRGEDHAASSEPGVGLGLSMCKSLADLHGGAIGCESQPGQGSLFWAELPVARAEPAAAGTQPGPAPVLWVGPPTPPEAIAGLVGRTLDAGDIVRLLAGDKAALAAYVVAADAGSLTPELRAALTEALQGERRPSLVLTGARRGEAEALDRMATASAYGSSDAETAVLIATVARWHRRLASPLEDQPPADAAAPVNLPLAILVADDNALNRDVTRRMLEVDGHTVTLAETGDDALRVLLDGEVEIALLDISMPGMSGIDVCRSYRTCLGGARPIPVIGVTAAIGEELRRNCLEAGMVDVLGRPVTIEQLRAAIARYRRTDGEAPASLPPPDDAAGADDAVADVQRMQLLKDLFGEEKLHTQFLPSFERDLGAGIERLRDAARQGEPGLIRDAIHAIKSSASTAGAKEVLAIALDFQIERAEAEIDAFEARIEAAYDRYCARLDGGDVSEPPPRRVAAAGGKR
jgi:signal transduction histidine kinase/CheY-like chemotaxis protein/HPt (histidine-containing phosphotransfer) domain-containing protein